MYMTPPITLTNQRGITLIESLVAIVVMVLGILGIMGLQMRTLTDTQASVRRGQAIRLIEDLAERLQNNPDALGHLNIYTTTPTSTDDCAITTCAPDKLAAYDIKQWRTSVANTLPDSVATVFIPKDGERQLGVLIAWIENQYNQNGQSFTTAEKIALNTPLVVSGTRSDGSTVDCPADNLGRSYRCHLQYIQPTQRCTPWPSGGGVLYCPN